jgi:hypothetical protein
MDHDGDGEEADCHGGRRLTAPSGAVLFDSGTTTAALAANLPRKSSLVAVTNSLPIALELMVYPQLTVHMLGARSALLRRLQSARGRCAN